MSEITRDGDYRQALDAIKQRIQSAQARAVSTVNAELLNLYWDIGRQLVQLQDERGWDAAVVEQMARHLQASYPGIKGSSRTSLFAMRQLYAFLSPAAESVLQPAGQMPWGHVRTLLAPVKSRYPTHIYACDAKPLTSRARGTGGDIDNRITHKIVENSQSAIHFW